MDLVGRMQAEHAESWGTDKPYGYSASEETGKDTLKKMMQMVAYDGHHNDAARYGSVVVELVDDVALVEGFELEEFLGDHFAYARVTGVGEVRAGLLAMHGEVW